MATLFSVLGTKVHMTAGAYCGTKYAIEALSEALRMELAGALCLPDRNMCVSLKSWFCQGSIKYDEKTGYMRI